MYQNTYIITLVESGLYNSNNAKNKYNKRSIKLRDHFIKVKGVSTDDTRTLSKYSVSPAPYHKLNKNKCKEKVL